MSTSSSGHAEETFDVSIRSVASGGDGIGELPDGRVVFVPRTAPGDVVRIELEQDRTSWARGRRLSLLTAGDVRVAAPCPLYDRCGGCQLQHLPYPSQLEWKGRFVVDALERIGHLDDVPEPEVVASPDITRYRNRITFTLRRLRGGRIVGGFHAVDRPSRVIDVEDQCLLPRPRLAAAWSRLREGWGSGADRLPDGGRIRLTLREAGAEVELLVQGGPERWNPKALVENAGPFAAVWHTPTGADDDDIVLVAGEMQPGGGTAFEQINPRAAELLREHAGICFGDATSSGVVAVDAYCGGGDFGRLLGERGWRVLGIESDPLAAEAAAHHFDVMEGRVEDHLGRALRGAELLVVNPPRAGLADEVPATVLEHGPPRLVYVSCDPATLARDVRALSEGYTLSSLRCFDLFPQTSHVETVAVLDARGERS